MLTTVRSPGESLRLIRKEAIASGTAQTRGMTRFAGISKATAGSRAIFMGETHVAPRRSSGPHHHGVSETCIYVVSGKPVFVYKEAGERVRLEARPGDYIYVPPHVPHIEENPHDEPAVIVLARTTQEAIVENLDEL